MARLLVFRIADGVSAWTVVVSMVVITDKGQHARARWNQAV
jgi:hypothetical protein